jgi:hypothetical protein
MAIMVPRSDADILTEAREAVQRIRGADAPEAPLTVSVQGGRLTVSGNAATAAMRASLRTRLEAIAGVVAVSDRMVDDDSLQGIVQSIIDYDSDLASAGHKVHVVMGTVYIDWSARHTGREQYVRDTLLRLPGVRAVVHGSWSKQQAAEQTLRHAQPNRRKLQQGDDQ